MPEELFVIFIKNGSEHFIYHTYTNKDEAESEFKTIYNYSAFLKRYVLDKTIEHNPI